MTNKDKRKILITNGFDIHYIILTDALPMEIFQWIAASNAVPKDDRYSLKFKDFPNDRYIKILHHPATDPKDDLTIIGYDEIYDLDYMNGLSSCKNAVWQKGKTGRMWSPYYYTCTDGRLTLSLSPPYKSDPWGVRLSENGNTIHKDVFRMETSGYEDPDRIEDAKEMAFELMEDYISKHMYNWSKLQSELCALKMGSKNKK